ncbi:MAG: tRNA guanosine(34) transglycosylase Tgt, partial [Planctomycetota bacterium]
MTSSRFSFQLKSPSDQTPRLGQISTPHGKVDTPAFMPVGTVGTVKG